MFLLKIKSHGFLVILLASILGFSLRANAAGPSYSVNVGGGSFSPNPIAGNMTASASLTGTLNVQNPNQEIQESGDRWTWSASVTGYKATSQAAFGSVPNGIAPPVVGASSGSATSSVTATSSKTTTPATFPGYYQITVSATDSFTLTDSSTKPATTTLQTRTGTTTLTIIVAVLDITWTGHGTITDSTGNLVVVGMGVQLQAQVVPADLLPTPIPSGLCSWTVEGNTVYSYTATNTSSQCIGVAIGLSASNPNGLASPVLHYYWVNGGTRNISLKISGISGTAQATFTVQRPTGANISPVPGQVMFDVDAGGNYYIHDGIRSFPYTGMEFDFTIDNTYSGQWQFVQLVQSTSRVFNISDGKSWSTHGPFANPVLDTNYPYSFVPDPNNGLKDSDSPGNPVNPLTLSPAYPSVNPPVTLTNVVAVTTKDSFKDWLMFQPGKPGDDTIPVPIGTFTWNWNGHASRPITNGQPLGNNWTPSAGSVAGQSVPGTYSDEQSVFPQWNANITQRYYAQP